MVTDFVVDGGRCGGMPGQQREEAGEVGGRVTVHPPHALHAPPRLHRDPRMSYDLSMSLPPLLSPSSSPAFKDHHRLEQTDAVASIPGEKCCGLASKP